MIKTNDQPSWWNDPAQCFIRAKQGLPPYGIFVWYGIDSEGNVGVFLPNESVVPSIFFGDEQSYALVFEFFESLPTNVDTKTPLREAGEEYALTGVYAFEWENYGMVYEGPGDPYRRTGVPANPINLDDLPERIQLGLAQCSVRFSVRFSRVSELHIEDHFHDLNLKRLEREE